MDLAVDFVAFQQSIRRSPAVVASPVARTHKVCQIERSAASK
jgi:hypothetical protein